MKEKIIYTTICSIIAVFISGCGTDVKPSSILQILKDESEIDDLSKCVSDEPEISDEQITLFLDKQCIIDYSNKDRTEPVVNPTFPQIVANAERYMDKLLTFQAVVKKIHHHSNVELYTNDPEKKFFIHSREAPLYRLDSDGNQIPIEPNQKYIFKIRIYQMEKNVDHSPQWNINSEFIVSTEKKIIYLPVLVEE